MRMPNGPRQELLRLPRVGERVIGRLDRLAVCSVHEVIEALLQQPRQRSLDCGIWARSSLARSAVNAVLRYAKTQVAGGGTRDINAV